MSNAATAESLPREPADAIDPKAVRRDPLLWARRAIERSTRIRRDDKAHVLLWLEDIASMTPQDQRARAAAMTAAISYAHVVRISAASLRRVKGGIEKESQLASMLTRHTTQMTRSLRLAGMQPKSGQAAKKASAFSPARRNAGHREPVTQDTFAGPEDTNASAT